MNASNTGKSPRYKIKAGWWIMAAGVIGYLFGCMGFIELATGSNSFGILGWKLSPLWSAPYDALQMFVLNPPNQGGPIPLSLHIGRLLAAVVFLWATYKVVFVVLQRHVGNNLRRVKRKGHVVICGLGNLGLRLAREARARGERVVAIEKDPGSENVGKAIDNKIKVIYGDAGEESTLRRAGVETASRVFAVCSDDRTNLTIAHILSHFEMGPASKSKLECWLFIANPKLRASLRGHDVFGHKGSACHVNVRGLGLSDLRARQAFQQLSLNLQHLPSVTQPDWRPRLILTGFGEMGQSLALQAARIAHFPSGGRLEITVVDDRAGARIAEFFEGYPNMREIADFQEIPGGLESPGNYAKVLEAVKGFEKSGELLVCIACNDDDDEGNWAFALDMMRDHPNGSAPVLVYLSKEHGFFPVLESHAA
ncbi:MAG: potassium channel family protein [Syntrophobacteraceae bacterium]